VQAVLIPFLLKDPQQLEFAAAAHLRNIAVPVYLYIVASSAQTVFPGGAEAATKTEAFQCLDTRKVIVDVSLLGASRIDPFV
jgi:hypothetical protein